MSSSISRFTGSDFMLSLKPNDEPRFFKSVSETPFLKNKEYAWNLLGISCRNLSMSKNPQTTTFVRHSSVNPPPEAPVPSGSPYGSLRNWIVGIVLTLILPFFTHKWGSLLLLKNKVDKKIETTEHVVKTVENVAERVDKVIDSITDDLPEDSKLKKGLEFVDEIAEGIAKGAHVADKTINKVEEAEDKLESLITHENSKGDEIPHEEEDKEDQEITEQKRKSDKNIK
ncbi:hypothetical protein L1987_22636 [Smallanthus sonchifolius]|uniref:Uncharacterized protein n=1 Tax=Smallanthus sonchifolius TaxID=185202 RepID=A0ACB9IF81_9ASTR|nr:hypothetical protein L1987_22636 [Smallanthus sonchifolius]